MSRMRPTSNDYSPAHAAYVALVPEDDVLGAIEHQSSDTQKFLAGLDESKAAYRYADGKWSVKQVLGHIIDAERIISYRLLAIARGETNPLPGFDENMYVENAGFDAWSLGDLAEHYALVRRSTIVLLRNLPKVAWTRRGIANTAEVSVLGLTYVILGHERHHVKVLRERYKI
jgi:uncharacterized damage-inducible protein DinB